MITVEYKQNIAETANATLDFIYKRPVIKFIMLGMKICCFIMIVACIIKTITKTINTNDISVVLFAIAWIFYYKSINSFILKRQLKKQDIDKITKKFHISKHKLWWQTTNNQPVQQFWNRVKYIYKNKDGYIVPSHGISNAGKFIWLPKRGFVEPANEIEFLELLDSLKIKVKS